MAAAAINDAVRLSSTNVQVRLWISQSSSTFNHKTSRALRTFQVRIYSAQKTASKAYRAVQTFLLFVDRSPPVVDTCVIVLASSDVRAGVD